MSNKKNTDPNKPKRQRKPLSEETKRKISEKRRHRSAMGNNPRKASQSKKKMSLAEELISEYSSKKGRTDKERKKRQEALEWLKNNKEDLGWRDNADERIALAKEWGVCTEFSEMYPNHHEQKVGAVFYDENEFGNIIDMNDPLNILIAKEENEGLFND